jgi:2-polyprenyl-6-methoxyphenol hydroxylase-like FAD-dependent oxidoreductase
VRICSAGSLELHTDTGQRAMRLAGLEQAFLAKARPEDQGDRLYDPDGALLFDRDGLGDDRPEVDRTALRQILLDSLGSGTVRWDSKVETITPAGNGGHHVVVGGAAAPFDIVVGADGAWSRVRPLLSNVAPAYEGVTLVELGFDVRRHSAVDTLVGGGKMFAVGDNRALIAQRNGDGHIRGYAARRMSASRPGLTLVGDAAHVMSPFGGQGVNLALADAADLADALTSGEGWPAVARYEAVMVARATPAAAGAAEGLHGAISSVGAAGVLEHYRQRVAT